MAIKPLLLSRRHRVALLLSAGLMTLGGGHAQAPSAPKGEVTLSGVVPDEATRQALLAKARAVYGDRVVDQLGVGPTAAPPNWSAQVQRLITPGLAEVHRGALRVEGNEVEVTGEVQSDEQRRSIGGQMSGALNPTYTVRNGLQLAGAGVSGQSELDAQLAKRTIEFESGNAVLSAVGVRTLDALLPLLERYKGRRLEIIGHTDAQGSAVRNQSLSEERAEAVKSYLAGKGLAADSMSTAGRGATLPIADNGTAQGRSRNRRIEIRLLP